MNTTPVPQNQTEAPFSLWYYLCGRQSNLKLPPNEHIALTTTGVVSLMVAVSYAIFCFIFMDKCIGNSTTLLQGFMSLVILVFILYFNRSLFVYIQKRNRTTKWVAISSYLLLYTLISVLAGYLFLFFYLETEISARLAKNSSSLRQAESLQIVLASLTTEQKYSVESFRWIIGSVFFVWSFLPLLNMLFFIRNANVMIYDQNLQLLQELKFRLLKQKEKYALLGENSVTQEDGLFADEEQSPELIQQQKQDILMQIQHLEESINLL